MKKTLLIFLLSLLTVFAFAQEHKGIHQIEWEEHLNDTEQTLFYKNAVPSVNPITPRDASNPGPTHAIFGYLPDWEHTSAPPYFDYSILSHIALFDFTVSTNGDISGYPAGWPSDWTSMMNTAHANGVKLIMCVVEFNDDDINALINSTTASNNFYQNIASIITTYNLDGVNIDFEGPKTSDRGAPMNTFMQNLTNYIKTNVGTEQEVSFAGPAVNWSGWDLPGLVDACDYVFIMGYAYWYVGSSTTGPCAPITGSTYNLEQTLANSSNGYGSCDKSKLILGLPYYGQKWTVSYEQRAQENASTLARGSSIFYASAKDLFSSHGRQWSTRYEDPWTYYQSGSDWYQAWCNDAQALDAKEKLVFTYGLMGTGMWALGYDDEHQELWDVLRDNFLPADSCLMIDNFEDGMGHFYRQPTYSGSTDGISLLSSSDTSSEAAYVDEHSLKLSLVDDAGSTDDWRIRLLSGNGETAKNVLLSTDKELRFALKTFQEGMEISVMVDDWDSQLEISDRVSIIGDGLWHTYAVAFDSADTWSSYYNGNGRIDASYVTLDALMFYAPNQSASRVVYMDALEIAEKEAPLTPAIESVPDDFMLHPNYPNPFNASTTLNYDITRTSDVRLAIYDINGRLVQNLIKAIHAPGSYTHNWNCTFISSGVYIAVLQVDGKLMGTQKMLLVK